MFFLGLELDLNQIKTSWKTTLPIASASILIPGQYIFPFFSGYGGKIFFHLFILVGTGCTVAVWFYNMNSDLQTSKAAFILFIGKKYSIQNIFEKKNSI